MSGFLYRGRHCTGNQESIQNSRMQRHDWSSGETEKGPSLQQPHSLREFEKHLNDLKKENFSLKLRIYFLEEKIQSKFEDGSSEDVHRKNIELKVEVESLKQELLGKHQLDKILQIETPAHPDVPDLQHHCEERQQISHIQEVLENKIQEVNVAQSEADKMASLAASESQHCVDLENRMTGTGNKHTQEEMLAEKDRRVQTLTEDLLSKDEEVMSLQEEKDSLAHKVTQLEKELQVKSEKEMDVKKLREEQQVQVQCDHTASQCVTELQKAQRQLQSLQAKITERDVTNKELQQQLIVLECDLLSLRETAQGQERTIQTLYDALSTKDSDIADLQRFGEEQEQLLISLQQQNQKEQLQKLQASTTGPSPVQVELLELQASLFLTQLELQSVQRAQHHVQRREEEVVRANQRLLTKIQEEQHHYQEAKKHNQELLAALQRAHSDLEQMEERWKEGEADQESKVEERERTIRELKNKLQHKEHLLHDYTELLDEQKETGGDRDVLIHKLKLRIQNRDRALECAVDEKFVCVEQKVAEVHRLQLLIREKERDLQKLRCVLSNNEETITSLEMLVRGKSVELEQVSEAWRGSQQVQRECEDRHNCSMKERDTLINQLQTSLHMCTKQLEDLTAALVSDVPQSSGEVMEKLRAQLQVKERLFQELLAEHNRQTQEHHKQLQELLYAIHTREQCIKESAERVGQVMSEQAARVQELRRQVVSAGRKSVSTSEPSEDARVLREELQLVLSKEREAQRELTMLRSTLTNREEHLQVQNAQQHTLNYTSKPVQSASMGTEQTVRSHTRTGDCTVDVEEEEDGGSSAFVERTEEAEHCRVTAQVLFSTQDYDPHEDPLTCQSPTGLEGQGLAEVELLLEQKQAVEHELWELKAQLQRTGFTSFSQMRKAFLSLRLENEELRDSVSVNEAERAQRGREVQWQPKPCEGKTRCSRTLYLDPEAQVPHNTQLIWPKLQDKLPVSKICRQAETGRHGDHREQLIDSPVQPYRKQVQVDLQDLGYETCGRSENEAERDDTSSPEFDDLELCTSLSYRDDDCRWWTGPFAAWRAGGDVASLQQVEDLQVEFSRSQAQVLHLQDQPVDATPKSTLQKSNWDDGEMQELETRVSSLEEKLKKRKVHAEQETRSPPRTGEFDALIQAQARELSHLRQRMREGRSVCHILTQHLGDTTKSFEELLRDNDIDYYMGQNFRDQLAQSTTLALRVRAKISSRDYSEIPDDKTDHELLAIRFSKELKEKNKLIESLSTKLEQLQQLADAPTRNQLPAGGAEQFERAPLVMDEQGSTNKDLDLCSELDTISKFGQEEVTDDSLQPVPSHPLPSNPSTIKSSHSHRSSTCCSSMHCTPHRLIDGQIHTGLSSAHVKPVTGVCFPTNSSDFHFKRSAFASLHANPNITYGAQQNRESAYNDSSSSSSGYHSSAPHTSTNPVGSPGTNLMEEHLREIRSLHRCLEESIQTNEHLRHQLAEKLDSKIQDGGAPTNIYIQGLDSISQLSSEVRALKEENKTLQHELQASRDGVKQVEELRDAVLLERSRLEQAELEAEKWAGQFRQLQAQLQEHTQAVLQLKQDKQNSQEHANRLQHEVNVLQQQLSESRRLVHELQAQIELQQKWSSITLQSGEEVQELPSHIHTFEQQLSDRLDSDVLHSSTGKHFFPGYQERKLSDGSIICRTGCHVVGHWADFSALQQHLSEGKVLICSVEAALQFSMRSNLHEGCINNVLSNTKTLKQILEETSRIIKTFWRADLPHTETATALCQQEQTLRDEVVFLRHKLVDREQNLRAMFETLRNSNRTKDSMEQFIVSQLSRTHDLLRTARMNLEKNELRIQSLSCSFSPPSPLSFSLTPPWLIRGEISNTGYSSSSQHSVLTSLDHKPAKRVSWEMPHPLQMLSVNARSTLHTSAPTPC